MTAIFWRCAAIAIAAAALGCQGSGAPSEATSETRPTTTTSTTTAERVVYVYREGTVDALAASQLARRGVVLPVPSCGVVPADTLDALRTIGATAVRRVGGPDAVCDDVMRQLEEAIPEPR